MLPLRDLSCTYLTHHELEGVVITIVIIINIIIFIMIIIIIIIIVIVSEIWQMASVLSAV